MNDSEEFIKKTLAELPKELNDLADKYCIDEGISAWSPEGLCAFWAFIAGYKAAQKSTN